MKFVVAIVAALILAGCSTQTIIQKEIVTVDKPIPFIPKPPEVPKFVSQVDKLTAADASDPGKVGQAYKYDTLMLRKLIAIYEQILAQYSASSTDFDKIKGEIDKIYADINAAETKAVDNAAKK